MASFEFQHPQFGVLAYEPEEGVWQGYYPLRAFEASGWNLQHVGDHVAPTYDRQNRRLRPPPGERFAPLREPPAGFTGRGVRIEFRASEDASADAEEVPPPTAGQVAALRFVIEREQTILEALAHRYRRQDLGHERVILGEDLAKLTSLFASSDGVRSLVLFEAVCVSNREGPAGPAVGFYGDDALDPEHGFGVVTRRGQVLNVGGSDIGWRVQADPASP